MKETNHLILLACVVFALHILNILLNQVNMDIWTRTAWKQLIQKYECDLSKQWVQHTAKQVWLISVVIVFQKPFPAYLSSMSVTQLICPLSSFSSVRLTQACLSVRSQDSSRCTATVRLWASGTCTVHLVTDIIEICATHIQRHINTTIDKIKGVTLCWKVLRIQGHTCMFHFNIGGDTYVIGGSGGPSLRSF